MAQKNIAVIIGSLRKDSFNRKMANAVINLAPQSIKLEIVEIGELSPYNQDIDSDPPATWTNFRNKIKKFDGVLFVTPEYNRSIPGVLKNAIDIGSRPSHNNIWDQKPSAVISVTPGTTGAFGANHHLRQVLVAVNMPTMPQPEAYISKAATLFDDSGILIVDSTREFMKKFMDSFAEWVNKNVPQ